MSRRHLPWDHDTSQPLLSTLLGAQRDRHPRHPSLYPPLPSDRLYHHERRHRRSYTPHPNPTYSADLDTSDFSSSSWDSLDPYTLDTDPEERDHQFRIPPPTHHHQRPPRIPTPSPPYHHRPHTPTLLRTTISIPTQTATYLHHSEILILPALTHLHIHLYSTQPHSTHPSNSHTIHAAVPPSMPWGALAKQLVTTYYGSHIRPSAVVACARLRDRWIEPGPEMIIEELARRDEVRRDEAYRGRQEIEVKIIVGEDGEGEGEVVDGQFPGGPLPGGPLPRGRRGVEEERRRETARESRRGVERVRFAEREV